MKSTSEFNNPLDTNDKFDFNVLINFKYTSKTYAKVDFNHATMNVACKHKGVNLNLCYLEYLEFIVDNYYNLPNTIIFNDCRVFDTLNKNKNHSLRDDIIRKINELDFMGETQFFNKLSRVNKTEEFSKFCMNFGVTKPPTKYAEIPIYAINRLSILKNQLDYYKNLLNYAKQNQNLEYIAYIWLYIFDVGSCIPSLYKKNEMHINEQINDWELNQLHSEIKTPLKIEAVTVCLNYSECLEKCISNKNQFDRWIIVTSKDDIDTQKVCKKYNLECVISKRIHEPGDYLFTHNKLKTDFGLKPAFAKFESAPLAKGKAINDGLKFCNKKDWIVHIDADVLLPTDFKSKIEKYSLETQCLYGLAKRTNEFGENVGSWINGLGIGKNGAIGWFQMFHANEFQKRFKSRYSEQSADTWWDDVIFAEKFGDNQRCFKDIFAKTLQLNSSSFQIHAWNINSKKQRL